MNCFYYHNFTSINKLNFIIMKKKKISLKKEVIANLSSKEMGILRGGGTTNDPSPCFIGDPSPTTKNPTEKCDCSKDVDQMPPDTGGGAGSVASAWNSCDVQYTCIGSVQGC